MCARRGRGSRGRQGRNDSNREPRFLKSVQIGEGDHGPIGRARLKAECTTHRHIQRWYTTIVEALACRPFSNNWMLLRTFFTSYLRRYNTSRKQLQYSRVVRTDLVDGNVGLASGPSFIHVFQKRPAEGAVHDGVVGDTQGFRHRGIVQDTPEAHLYARRNECVVSKESQ